MSLIDRYLQPRALRLVEHVEGLIADQQVRPADVPDEQRVARQHEPGFLAPRSIGDEIAGVLRRVSRRRQRLQPDTSRIERLMRRQRRETVSNRRRVKEPMLGASDLGELPRARDEVGVDVRLEDLHDGHAEVGRLQHVEIDAEIRNRIDDECFFRSRAAEQVRRLSEPLEAVLLEYHDGSPFRR